MRRTLPPPALSVEPPPLRPGTRRRPGIPSRNGRARGQGELRQRAPPSRTGARRLGLDVDRTPRPGPSLRRPHVAQVARLHARRRPDARHRNRRQRGRLRLLRSDGAASAQCAGSRPRCCASTGADSPYAFALPYPEVAFFRENSRTLSAVIAVNSTSVAVEGEEKQLNASFVTGEFLPRTGRRPQFSAGCSTPRGTRRPARSRWSCSATDTGSATSAPILGRRQDDPPERQAGHRDRGCRQRFQRSRV